MIQPTKASTATKRPAPNECPSRHMSLLPCATCGGTPPRSDLLHPFGSGPDSWFYWHGRNVIMGERHDPTPPEQLREIEAANAAYNAAQDEHARCTVAYAKAATAETGSMYRIAPDYAVVSDAPAMAIRRREEANEAFLKMEAAEAALAAALKELNRVSVPMSARKSSSAAGALARRALRAVLG